MRHLLGIADLDPGTIEQILADADHIINGASDPATARGRHLLTLFFEHSTRTMQSFHTAARRLGMHVADLPISRSSVEKGESFADTLLTVKSLNFDVVVIRHPLTGAAHFASRILDCPVVNAGDGTGEHPTQALLDALTIRQHKGRIAGLRVTIIGDIRHSRVARSNVHLLTRLGAEVWLSGPPTMLPHPDTFPGVTITPHRETALAGSDVVMVLRLQRERQGVALISSDDEYRLGWGIDLALLDKYCPGALVMHPGPVNRGIEMNSQVLSSPRCAVSDQVRNGVAVRMAVLSRLLAERLEQ